MATIRWGLIGCGEVAETKSGPALCKATDSALVAVADRNRQRAESFARRHGIARWHDDADAVIGAKDIDAVYVATMTDSHCELVLRCAEAGKAVLVEKPMAMTFAQCKRMARACRAAKVPLWVAFYRRALPRFVELRELVDGAAVGSVRMVLCRHLHRIPTPEQMAGPFWGWRLDRKRSGGGIFFEAVAHTLDILDFVFGPIAGARALAGNQAGAYAVEDVVTVAWRFASGAYGSGAWCFATDGDDEYNEIVGTTGRIRFSTFPPLAPPAGRPPAPIRVQRGDALDEIAIADPPYVHQPLIQSIVDEMNGRGRCPSTAESAMRTMKLIEDCLADFSARPGARKPARSRARVGTLDIPS